MRQVNIEDCVTVFTPPEDDLSLMRQLRRSLQAGCNHPNKVQHNSGREPDSGEWYRAYHCGKCEAEWTEYDEPEIERMP